MAIEIERKFLVVGDSWREQAHQRRQMVQGYLVPPGGAASVRVRVDDAEARMNIKAAVVGPARSEYDYAVPEADAREMLDTLCVGRVEKVRHLVRHEGLVWEVDEFGGDNAGLIVAEVELDASDQAISMPAWAGAEVTDDARYYNHALAVEPFCGWGEGTT